MRAAEFPIEFYCPLARKVMADPVVIQSGRSFEREAIEKFFGRGKIVDPISGQRLGTTKVSRNQALASLIKKQWGIEERERELFVNNKIS